MIRVLFAAVPVTTARMAGIGLVVTGVLLLRR